MGPVTPALFQKSEMAFVSLSALFLLACGSYASDVHYGIHYGAQGGARIRLSSKGLQYGASVGVGVLDRELKKVVIPDQGGKDGIAIGEAEWAARNIRITNVKVPNYK